MQGRDGNQRRNCSGNESRNHSDGSVSPHAAVAMVVVFVLVLAAAVFSYFFNKLK